MKNSILGDFHNEYKMNLMNLFKSKNQNTIDSNTKNKGHKRNLTSDSNYSKYFGNYSSERNKSIQKETLNNNFSINYQNTLTNSDSNFK